MKLLIALSFLTIIVVMVFLNSTHESTDSALQKASAQTVRFEYTTTLPTEEKSPPTEPETVVCSFYGGEKRGDFHGKKMANGKRFNKNDPTIAASNELPLGTKIQVTNVENGKSAVLTVEDRGGFEKYGRSLDISQAAAKKLGFFKEGLARVEVIVLAFPEA